MQRLKHVDAALQVWAMWRLSATGGYRSPSFEFTDSGENTLRVVEMAADVEREALLMDRAIAALPLELRKTVVATYTWQGGVEVICEKMKVTRATIHRRLCHADIRIDEWLLTYQEQRQKYCRLPLKNNFATYTN